MGIKSFYNVGPVTLVASGDSPVRLDSGNLRNGIEIVNNTAYWVYVGVIKAGDIVPDDATLTDSTGAVRVIPPRSFIREPWTDSLHVYAVGSSAIDIDVFEYGTDTEVSSTFGTYGESLLATVVDTSAARIMTQERGTFTNLTADGIAYSGPCVLRRVIVNTGSAGSVVVYDNTSAAGTKVATINGANPGVFDYGCTVSNGVYIDLAAGQDVTVIVEPV